MTLTARLRYAMILLGEHAITENLVTDAMLTELASLGIIDYDPTTGSVKFTEAGKLAYRDSVGHFPTRNV